MLHRHALTPLDKVESIVQRSFILCKLWWGWARVVHLNMALNALRAQKSKISNVKKMPSNHGELFLKNYIISYICPFFLQLFVLGWVSRAL